MMIQNQRAPPRSQELENDVLIKYLHFVQIHFFIVP